MPFEVGWLAFSPWEVYLRASEMYSMPLRTGFLGSQSALLVLQPAGMGAGRVLLRGLAGVFAVVL